MEKTHNTDQKLELILNTESKCEHCTKHILIRDMHPVRHEKPYYRPGIYLVCNKCLQFKGSNTIVLDV